MAFKIAYCAGHYIGTAGKRVPKELDPNQTREWTLNDRVADHFATAAAQYEGVELLRTDDPTGKQHIAIKDRTADANRWGADIYIDMHHNAAGKVFAGGGVVAYSYPNSTKGKAYRDAIYEAVIAAGNLKGNRAEPLQEKKFDSLRYAHAPAVLMEYGFIDSTKDYPVISTDEYAKAVGYATMEGIAKVAGLKKKQKTEPKPAQNTTKNPTKTVKAKDSAKSFNKSLEGTYTVTASTLNIRHGAGVTKSKMTTIPRGTAVKCYGYYSTSLGVKWLYIQFTYNGVQYTGFASSKYLKKG